MDAQREIQTLEEELESLKRRVTDEYQRGYRDAMLGNKPHYISEGSFGRITTLSMSNSVYKSTILGDRSNVKRLEHEFQL
jgi:hypothetical protein